MVRNERFAVVLSEVEAVLEALGSTASIAREDTRDEFRLTVSPLRVGACPFSLTLSSYDTYGLSFGHGLAFEDIVVTQMSPVDVVRAITDGRVSETIWRLFGRIVKSVGAVHLTDGRVLGDRALLTVFGAFGLGREEVVSYRPYVS